MNHESDSEDDIELANGVDFEVSNKDDECNEELNGFNGEKLFLCI